MLRKLFFLVIGTTILVSCGPFGGFPPEYQKLTLPQEMTDIINKGGNVVPLPKDSSPLQEELKAAADSYDLSPYDLSRIVAFPSEEKSEYSAVPIQPGYFKENFKNNYLQGELVGLVYDKLGKYNGTPGIFEVRFFDDRATLRPPEGEEITLTTEKGDFVWTSQKAQLDIPVACFIKGSCHLCWGSDGRGGCLICFQEEIH